MDKDLDLSHIVVEGQFVSAKVSRIVQAIREYSDELEVQWVPPTAREEGVAAYKIRHNPPGGMSYTLFHVKNDEDFDERVLARIIANDQRTRPVQLSELEAWEEAQRRCKHQEFLDALEEANDKAAFALRTPLHTYTMPDAHGKVIKIRE
jgi:hypothetical protein